MNPFCGYIEGYYGKLLTWLDRRFIVDTLSHLSLSTYVYAPKEDPFHRQVWKQPYPRNWDREFTDFVGYAKKKRVKVVPSLAPGLSFDYNDPSDYRILLRKFNRIMKTGVSDIALLMDDIPPVLPRSCVKSFVSLGEAHGLLLQKLKKDVSKTNPNVTLWFCPTVYTDQFIEEGTESTRYLEDLARTAPSDVLIFWTGSRIVSPTITRNSIRAVTRLFPGDVVIWDNFYANDYCPRRLFFGPYTGRSPEFLSSVKGVLLNPTGLPHTDSFLLHLLSGALRGAQSKQWWNRQLENLEYAPQIREIAPFFASPFVPCPRITPSRIRRIHKALDVLKWRWKSGLQVEWYPYLFSLDTDVSFWEKGKDHAEPEWIAKKYPPVLAELLRYPPQDRAAPRH